LIRFIPGQNFALKFFEREKRKKKNLIHKSQKVKLILKTFSKILLMKTIIGDYSSPNIHLQKNLLCKRLFFLGKFNEEVFTIFFLALEQFLIITSVFL